MQLCCVVSPHSEKYPHTKASCQECAATSPLALTLTLQSRLFFIYLIGDSFNNSESLSFSSISCLYTSGIASKAKIVFAHMYHELFFEPSSMSLLKASCINPPQE